jgi:hypothetical protein
VNPRAERVRRTAQAINRVLENRGRPWVVGNRFEIGAGEHQVRSGTRREVIGEPVDHRGRIVQPVPLRHLQDHVGLGLERAAFE